MLPKISIVSLTLLLLVGWTTQTVLAAQDIDVEVGDVIEFKFLRDTVQGTVQGFTAVGWPEVAFERNGHDQTTILPKSRILRNITLEESEGAGGMTSEMRTWTDATGKFKIEAKMLGNEDGGIELEKKDGRVITLPLDKLSKTDQEFVAELESQSSSANPFAGGKKRNSRSSGKSRSSRNRGSASAVTSPNYAENELYLSDPGWNVTPDAATTVDSSSNKILPFAAKKNKHDFHNRFAGIQLSGNKRWLASCISNPFDNHSQIVRIDLESGRSAPPSIIERKDAKLIGISSDGSQAAVIKDRKGGQAGSLEFWKLGDSPEKTGAWKTASFHDRDGFSPKSGLFFDGARLMTFGRRVVMWDCAKASAIYSFSIDKDFEPALSPNRKQLAVVENDLVYIVDAENGEALGMISPPETPDQMAFSNNGRFLAGLNRQSHAIWVWDLRGNKLLQELSSELGGGREKSFEWVGDKYLFVDNTSLVDVKLRAKVWQYDAQNSGTVISANDGRFWFASKNKVAPFKLPHKDLDAMTDKFDPKELLVLKPGSSVAIKFVRLTFSPSEQKNIRETLSKHLSNSDVSVVENEADADLVLVAEVKRGKTETVEVSDFFSGPWSKSSEKITYTPNYASLSLEKDGVEVWKNRRSFEPSGIIHVNEGENAQRAANRICKPTTDFFLGARFPKYIGQLPNGKPLGSSRLAGGM